MKSTLARYQKLSSRPFGKSLFSLAVNFWAPYFRTIRPRVMELKPGLAKIRMRKRWSVTNHIKSVHAIAMCNLCEYTAGLAIEVSIPKHLRWIPVNMNVDYLKIAKTNLMAICKFEVEDWDSINNVPLTVFVRDLNQVEVVRAVITMRVSAKKNT